MIIFFVVDVYKFPGEKPFLCPLCSYRCSRMDNLNIHTKKSHGLSVHEAEQQTGVSARMHTDIQQDHRNVHKQGQQKYYKFIFS